MQRNNVFPPGKNVIKSRLEKPITFKINKVKMTLFTLEKDWGNVKEDLGEIGLLSAIVYLIVRNI